MIHYCAEPVGARPPGGPVMQYARMGKKSLAEMAVRWYISFKQKKGVAEHPCGWV